jgi:ankyrin repeat protein
MRLLLEKGADINLRDYSEHTALNYSIRSGQIATTQLLLERGADVDAENKYGTTALCEAIAIKNELAAQLLLENGADPTNAKVEDLLAEVRGFDFVRQWLSKKKTDGQLLGLPYRDNRPS